MDKHWVPLPILATTSDGPFWPLSRECLVVGLVRLKAITRLASVPVPIDAELDCRTCEHGQSVAKTSATVSLGMALLS